MINDAWLAVEAYYTGVGYSVKTTLLPKAEPRILDVKCMCVCVCVCVCERVCYLAEYKHAKIAILTVHLRRLCGLMSNYFDHLLSFAVDKQKK